ncbi:ChaC-like protein [Umbelopsis sp. AD052]|nr:ChaC-like protein [Umbelopsis sp. AD052]
MAVSTDPNSSVVADNGIWVFGYGSLIWKPPISYEDKVVGYVKNYVRRFWQHSEDHRGTPEAPGRVVTLVPHAEWKTMDDYHDHKDDDVCWGVAFKIPGTDVETTRAYLDHREKALVYIGTTDNEAFVGGAPVDDIAQQIYESYGPSGWNAEYLLNLAHALREIAPESRDDHVFELEHKVKAIIDRNEQADSQFRTQQSVGRMGK